eukprot:11009921-Prorocentrum_lima.AAC.1
MSVFPPTAILAKVSKQSLAQPCSPSRNIMSHARIGSFPLCNALQAKGLLCLRSTVKQPSIKYTDG